MVVVPRFAQDMANPPGIVRCVDYFTVLALKLAHHPAREWVEQVFGMQFYWLTCISN
jgi:hypothetical protein